MGKGHGHQCGISIRGEGEAAAEGGGKQDASSRGEYNRVKQVKTEQMVEEEESDNTRGHPTSRGKSKYKQGAPRSSN